MSEKQQSQECQNSDYFKREHNEMKKTYFSRLLPLIVVLVFSHTIAVHAQVQDLAPPALVELNISPASVDVSTGPQSVTLTMRITDELSGFQRGFPTLVSPSNQQNIYGFFTSANLISGDAHDGVYQLTVSVPQFSEAGTWRIGNFRLDDLVNNLALLSEPDLIAAGLPTKLVVTGGPDLAPPKITELNISPASVDVSTGPQTVTLTMRITDELSGFQRGFPTLVSPSNQQNIYGFFTSANLISGDAHDGVYQLTVSVPQFSEAGTWRIGNFRLDDLVNNLALLSEPDLITAGLPTKLEIISVPDDVIPPKITQLNISPAWVDVSTGPQSVTLTMRITDELSGFQRGFPTLVSPSNQQNIYGFFTSANLISGDAHDGVYQLTVSVPQFSEAGTWRIGNFRLDDLVNNLALLSEPDLIAAGLPTEFVVGVNQPPVALSPANVWIGLKNSDDVGTKFDLLAEVFKNGSLVGSGQLNNVPGGSSGFNNAVSRTINLALSSPASIGSGDTLSIRLSVRIAVGVTGHRSGTARLWFNDTAANSRFGATIGGTTNDYFLLNAFALGSAVGPGPKKTIDVFVDRAVGGNPFKPFGTWSKTL